MSGVHLVESTKSRQQQQQQQSRNTAVCCVDFFTVDSEEECFLYCCRNEVVIPILASFALCWIFFFKPHHPKIKGMFCTIVFGGN